MSATRSPASASVSEKTNGKPASKPTRAKKALDPLYVSQRDIVIQRIATEAEGRYHRRPDLIVADLESEGFAFFRIVNPSLALASSLLALNAPLPTAEGETQVNRKSNAATVADYRYSMREGRWDANGQPLKFSVNPLNGWAVPPATWNAKAECGAYGAPIGPFDPFNFDQHAFYAGSLPDDAKASDYVSYAGAYGRAVCGSDARHRLTAYVGLLTPETKGTYSGHVAPIDRNDTSTVEERDSFAKALTKGGKYKGAPVRIVFEVYLSALDHKRLIRNQDTGRARSVAEALLLAEQPAPVVAWVAGPWNDGKAPDPSIADNFKKTDGVDAPLRELTSPQVAKLYGDATRAASGLIGESIVVSPSGKFRVDRIEEFGARQNAEGYLFADALHDTLAEPIVTYFLHRPDDSFAGQFVASEDRKTYNRARKARFGTVDPSSEKSPPADGLIVTDKAFALALFALMAWKYESGNRLKDFVAGLIDGSLAGRASVSNILSELAEWPGKSAGAASKEHFAFVLSRAWLAFTEGRAGKSYLPPHLTRAEWEAEKEAAEGAVVDEDETDEDETETEADRVQAEIAAELEAETDGDE